MVKLLFLYISEMTVRCDKSVRISLLYYVLHFQSRPICSMLTSMSIYTACHKETGHVILSIKTTAQYNVTKLGFRFAIHEICTALNIR